VHNTTAPASSIDRTFSIFLRRGSNNFAQLVGQSDETYLCNFDLLNGVIGTKGGTIRSAWMQPFVNGWYKCSVTTRSPLTTSYMVFLANSNSIPRGGTPVTNPSATIYVAAPPSRKWRLCDKLYSYRRNRRDPSKRFREHRGKQFQLVVQPGRRHVRFSISNYVYHRYYPSLHSNRK